MRKRGWILFFLGLSGLAAVAVITPWVLNIRQQLTSERLAEARSKWEKYGVQNYNLEYVEKIDVEPEERFEVQVRGGKVMAARCDGATLSSPVWTIDGMFDYIATTLQQDRDAGQHNYTVADFDRADGHPLRYVRRVRGTHDRLEWRIRLEPLRANVQ